MNSNINNNNNDFSILDVLTVIGFMAQLENMKEDSTEKDLIHKVIVSIADEISKLHKENDIIIEKINELLEKGSRS